MAVDRGTPGWVVGRGGSLGVVQPEPAWRYAPIMAESPPAALERRCATCGAVLYEGAEWCSMCFSPVGAQRGPEPSSEHDAGPELGGRSGSLTVEGSDDRAATTTDTSSSKTPAWPCPVCGGRNPIELDVCATCGTPFAALMRQEQARPKVDRRDAFRRSLLYPGLGHRMVGRDLDGFARGVLFTMLLLATLMLAFAGVSSSAVHFLFLLYAAATVGVYLMTALEAAQLADGGDLIVPSRVLLWVTVAILLVSVVVVALVIGTATRR